jgi:hypothetical protein
MANASAHSRIEGFTDKQITWVGEYDFANDTGAAATYSLGTFGHKMLVLSGVAYVETGCTSSGSATVIIGASTADVDAVLDVTSGAVANLTVGTTHTETAAVNLVVASGETLDLTIATAALTAGKIKVILECIKVA